MTDNKTSKPMTSKDKILDQLVQEAKKAGLDFDTLRMRIGTPDGDDREVYYIDYGASHGGFTGEFQCGFGGSFQVPVTGGMPVAMTMLAPMATPYGLNLGQLNSNILKATKDKRGQKMLLEIDVDGNGKVGVKEVVGKTTKNKAPPTDVEGVIKIALENFHSKIKDTMARNPDKSGEIPGLVRTILDKWVSRVEGVIKNEEGNNGLLDKIRSQIDIMTTVRDEMQAAVRSNSNIKDLINQSIRDMQGNLNTRLTKIESTLEL